MVNRLQIAGIEITPAIIISLISAGVSLLALSISYLRLQTQREQRRTMETAHETVLEVEDHDSTGDSITVCLSNNGQGTAKDLKLVCNLDVVGEPAVDPEPAAVQLSRTNDGEMNRNSSSIRDGQTTVDFEARTELGINDKNDNSYSQSFQAALSDITTPKVEEIELKLTVKSTDLMEKTDETEVFDEPCICAIHDLPQQATLETVIENRKHSTLTEPQLERDPDY